MAMPFLKFSILTCAIYVMVVLLFELGTIAFARLFGGVIYGGRPSAMALFFGSIWAVSYCLAWYMFGLRPIPH